jgi:branched-chain amino acid transport system permease protein
LAIFVILLVALLVRRQKLTRATETGIATWQAVKQVRDIPSELAGLREVKVVRQALRLAIIALAVVFPLLASPSRTQLASNVLVYAIIACSLVVLTGWAGHISLGQIAFMGFGAATTGILVANHGWDLWAGLGAGMAVAALVATLIGIPALRISGFYLAIVTIGFAVVSGEYFLSPSSFSWLPGEVPRPALFGRIDISSDRQMYYFCLVALAVALTVISTLRRSHVGRALSATKDNRLAAQSIGLSTIKLNLIAFAVSGAIAGLAGGVFVVLQANYNLGAFSADQGLTFFSMVVIGGLGSIPGAVLGALYVYGVQYLLPGGYSLLATGFGLLILLIVLPGGLAELVYRGRDAMLRLVANRRRIVVPSLVADLRVDLADPRLVSLPDPGLADPNGSNGAPAAAGRSRSRPVSSNGKARAGSATGARR